MKDLRPTHYICRVCKKNFYIVTDRRIKYTCECGQKYELVPTRYGGAQVLIGSKGEYVL